MHTQSSDTALLQLTIAGVAWVNFNYTRQQALLMSVQRVLQSNSYPGVTVTIYTVYEDSQIPVHFCVWCKSNVAYLLCNHLV